MSSVTIFCSMKRFPNYLHFFLTGLEDLWEPDLIFPRTGISSTSELFVKGFSTNHCQDGLKAWLLDDISRIFNSNEEERTLAPPKSLHSLSSEC